MVRIALALSLASSALALVPHSVNIRDPDAVGRMTLDDANRVCGTDLELKCCNEEKKFGDEESEDKSFLGNILNDVLSQDGLSLFDQCSDLSIPLIIGLDDIIKNQCKQKVACCDTKGDVTGLINVGLPCFQINGIL